MASPEMRVSTLAVGQGVAAALLMMLAAGAADIGLAHPARTAVYLVAFVAVEWLTIDLTVRDQGMSVSATEFVSAYALVFLDPTGFVLARAGAGLLIQLRKRAAPLRVTWNTTAFAVEAAATALIFRLVLGSAALTSPRAWIATVLALLIGQVLTALMIGGVMSATSGTSAFRAATSSMTTVLGISAVFSILGVATSQLTLWSTPAAVLGCIVAVMIWGLLRAIGVLIERQDTLTAFQSHTLELLSAQSIDDAARIARAAVHELTGAALAETDATGSAAVATVRGTLNGYDEVNPATLVIEGDLGAARILTERESDRRKVAGGALVPLSADEGSGYLLAGWAVRRRRNDPALPTLETIARQVEATTRRMRLSDKLQAELEEKAHRSMHDALTNLPNRTQLLARLDASDAGSDVAVILLDIDRFRAINETLGHESGDLVLMETALRLAACTNDDELLARVGSDEFCLLSPGVATPAGAEMVARRLTSGLVSGLEIEGLRLELAVTMGIAISSEHGGATTVLVRRAETALHEAKEAGETTKVYDGNEVDARRRLAVAAEVRLAAQDGRIHAWFQPKIEIATGKVSGVEALARWIDDDLGFVGPDEFISIAEQTGAIVAITHTILEKSIAQQAAWSDLGLDVAMSVNVSPRLLLEDGFPELVVELVERYGTRPERLVLEVTESLFVEGTRAQEGLDALRATGARLSIDDYGTGYSSLGYLHRLKAHELKIDRSFLMAMQAEPSQRIIVASTVQLAHGLGMKVVAEGVEDVETVHALAEMECDEMQGYLAARPMRGPDCTAWMLALPGGVWLPEQQAA